MSKAKMVPEIRFEGFDGEWEEVEVKEISGQTRGGGTPSTENPAFWKGDIPWISSSDLSLDEVMEVEPDRFITKEAVAKSATNIIPKDSVAIVTRVGVGKVAYIPYDFATSQDFLSLSELRTEPLFTSYLMMKEMKDAVNNLQGSTIKGVTSKEVLTKKISIPIKTEEQRLVGAHFKELDNIIKLRNEEFSQLKNFKQAMLQKMFPKEGEKVPEIRFEGFEGEWEELEISEIGEIKTGNTPSTNDESNYSDNGIIWITPTDINENVTTKTSKMLSKKGAVKATTVPSGSILVTSIASIGKNTLVVEEAGFNQQINAVTPKEGFHSYFLLTLSNHWSNKMKRTAASGTMQIVNRTEFSKMRTSTPGYDEQQQIGEYFEILDQNIQSKQAELEKLKQFKQAMLDKMFV